MAVREYLPGQYRVLCISCRTTVVTSVMEKAVCISDILSGVLLICKRTATSAASPGWPMKHSAIDGEVEWIRSPRKGIERWIQVVAYQNGDAFLGCKQSTRNVGGKRINAKPGPETSSPVPELFSRTEGCDSGRALAVLRLRRGCEEQSTESKQNPGGYLTPGASEGT